MDASRSISIIREYPWLKLQRLLSNDQELLTEELPRERQFEIQLQEGQRRGRTLRHRIREEPIDALVDLEAFEL